MIINQSMSFDVFGSPLTKKKKFDVFNYGKIIGNLIEDRIKKTPVDKILSESVAIKINKESARLEELINRKERTINSSVNRRNEDITKNLPKVIQESLKNNNSIRTTIDGFIDTKLTTVNQRLNDAETKITSANTRNTDNFTKHGNDIETLKGKQTEFTGDLKKKYKKEDGEALQQRLNDAEAKITSANTRNTDNFTTHGNDIETLKGKQTEFTEDLKKLRNRVDQENGKEVTVDKLRQALSKLDEKRIQVITKQLEYNVGMKVRETLSNLGQMELKIIADQLDSDLLRRVEVVEGRHKALDERVTKELKELKS